MVETVDWLLKHFSHEDIRETQIYVHIVRMLNPKKEAVKVGINDAEKKC